MDNLFSARQQRLPIEPLYSTWRDPEGRGFLADANGAVFASLKRPPGA